MGEPVQHVHGVHYQGNVGAVLPLAAVAIELYELDGVIPEVTRVLIEGGPIAVGSHEDGTASNPQHLHHLIYGELKLYASRRDEHVFIVNEDRDMREGHFPGL